MYLKGSKQPFCNLHYAELYKPQPEQMMDPFKTPVRQFKSGFPQTFPNYITMSAPNYLHGIAKFVSKVKVKT